MDRWVESCCCASIPRRSVRDSARRCGRPFSTASGAPARRDDRSQLPDSWSRASLDAIVNGVAERIHERRQDLRTPHETDRSDFARAAPAARRRAEASRLSLSRDRARCPVRTPPDAPPANRHTPLDPDGRDWHRRVHGNFQPRGRCAPSAAALSAARRPRERHGDERRHTSPPSRSTTSWTGNSACGRSRR